MQNPFIQRRVVSGGKVVVDEAGRHLGMVDAEALVGRKTQIVKANELNAHRNEKDDRSAERNMLEIGEANGIALHNARIKSCRKCA